VDNFVYNLWSDRGEMGTPRLNAPPNPSGRAFALRPGGWDMNRPRHFDSLHAVAKLPHGLPWDASEKGQKVGQKHLSASPIAR
jgi:hypothetical protein